MHRPAPLGLQRRPECGALDELDPRPSGGTAALDLGGVDRAPVVAGDGPHAALLEQALDCAG